MKTTNRHSLPLLLLPCLPQYPHHFPHLNGRHNDLTVLALLVHVYPQLPALPDDDVLVVLPLLSHLFLLLDQLFLP